MLHYLYDVTLQTWLVFLVIFLLAYNYVGREPWRRLPPGPPRLPLLGSIPFLGSSDMRVSFGNMARKYGDVITIYLGTRRAIVLSGYETVKEIFGKRGHQFADRPDLFFITDATNGYGIGSTQGAFWREQRRHALHVLRDFGVGRSILEDGVLSEVNHFIRELKRRANQPLCPMQLLQYSVANVICTITFGKRFEYDDPDFQEYNRLSSEGFEIVANSGVLNLFPFLRYLPGDLFRYRTLIRGRDFMDVVYRDIITDHRRTFDPEGEPRDVIDAYLKTMAKQAEDPNTTFTEYQLIRVIGELFSAGSETASNTLAWAVIHLTLNPEVQAKVQAEIDDVIKDGELPRMQLRSQLPYTDACISEVQRICDVVPIGVPHAAKEDTTFRGYLIPKGTMIVPNMNSIHLDPKVWPEPRNFDPTRFLDEEGKYRKREELIPFSLGKRSCLGEGLARMELFLYFVSMMQHFRFLVAPGYPEPSPEGVLRFTNNPKPFHIVLETRK